MRVLLSALFVLLCLVVAPGVARADAQEQLDLATTRYQNGKFTEAAEILDKLLRIPVDPDTREGAARRAVYLQARPIYVATLLAQGKDAEAREVALEQYRDDPFYDLPSGQFPQPVDDLFIEVRAAHRDEIEDLRQEVIADKQQLAAQRARLEKAKAERLRELERMASEQLEVVERSRWIALLPFGVGQFQNEDTGLGIFFAVSEPLAIAATAASAGVAVDLSVSLSNCENLEVDGSRVDCTALKSRFQTAQLINWVSFGTSAALIVAGIIEAQASFQGNKVVKKKREIPPPVEPEVMATESGALFGIRARF